MLSWKCSWCEVFRAWWGIWAEFHVYVLWAWKLILYMYVAVKVWSWVDAFDWGSESMGVRCLRVWWDVWALVMWVFCVMMCAFWWMIWIYSVFERLSWWGGGEVGIWGGHEDEMRSGIVMWMWINMWVIVRV